MRSRTVAVRRLIILPALFALAVPAVGAGRVENTGAVPTTLLVVQRLRDAGGLAPAAKGQPPLNEVLTTGVVRFLDEHKGPFQVWDARRHEPLKRLPGQKLLFVEGDLSRMAGETPAQDTYLLTMRLFEEGSPRPILAQWSGSARSLIYLTNNLHHNTHFSRNGLLGEIGDRIVVTACAYSTASREAQEKEFARLLSQLKTGKEVQAAAMPAATVPDGNPAPKEMPLVSGSAYQVEVASTVPGAIYAVGIGENGQLRPLLIPPPGKGVAITPGKRLRLPAEGNWKATETQKPLAEEIVVLVRHEPEPTARPASLVQTVTLESSDAPLPWGLGLEAEPDVQVIDGGNRLLPRNSPDPDIARLMEMIESDPPGTWLAARVILQIQPAKS